DFWAISGALLISCLVTLVFVGVLMQKLIQRQGKREEQP
ncbi:CidA/LrgA family protein, partial [Enterococcus faecium]